MNGYEKTSGAASRAGKFTTVLLWLAACAAPLAGWAMPQMADGPRRAAGSPGVSASLEWPGGLLAAAPMQSQDAVGIDATEALVEIEGIATLADFAAVERLLEELPGAQRVQLAEISGQSVTFSILIAGGASAVDQGLSGASRLTRAGAANARLVYRYRP